MTIQTSLTGVTRNWEFGDRSPGCTLRSRLGLAIMSRLRRAAIHALDLRTEFEVLEPGDRTPECPRRGLIEGAGLAISGRIRRAASAVLDPWTEFDAFDR